MGLSIKKSSNRSAAPVVVREIRVVNNNGGSGDSNGFGCCGVCRVCTCLRWGFVATPTGIVKAVEAVSELVDV